MSEPLRGIRVVEIASWFFVPSAGATLADWGAEVVKVEPIRGGDPIRGLVASTMMGGEVRFNYSLEHSNRGKRSVAVDLTTAEGREVVYRLVEDADVFITSLLPDARARFGVDVDDIRVRNPRIVYGKGSAVGPRGAEAGRGGYDTATYWGRGAVGEAYRGEHDAYPPKQTGAFGDLMSGTALAGGIAAALLQRERTSEVAVVDASLLASAMWSMAIDVTAAAAGSEGPSAMLARIAREDGPNPVVNMFRTADGRYLTLSLIQSDVFWAEFCDRIGRPELVDAPEFCDSAARAANRRQCTEVLDDVFAARPLDDWRRAFAGASFVWEPMQTVAEVPNDPQVLANGYLVEVAAANPTRRLVANPVQFDAEPPTLHRAPELGEDTEAVLLERGFSWDAIETLKQSNAII